MSAADYSYSHDFNKTQQHTKEKAPEVTFHVHTVNEMEYMLMQICLF